jgi:hypothetical protein
MLVDLAQTTRAHAAAKLVQDTHTRHLGLAAQTSELSPRSLLRQQFDQQVQRMHRREQTQQMNPIKLRRTVSPPPPTGLTQGPALVDKLVGHQWAQQFKQRRRASHRKIEIHALNLPPPL